MNELGEIVLDEWEKSAEIRREVELGVYTRHGHKLRFLSSGKAQFVTAGIISTDRLIGVDLRRWLRSFCVIEWVSAFLCVG